MFMERWCSMMREGLILGFPLTSIMYKTKLPFLLCFNKIDITSHEFAVEWMRNTDDFTVSQFTLRLTE